VFGFSTVAAPVAPVVPTVSGGGTTVVVPFDSNIVTRFIEFF